jgi:hypothetical protein
MGKEKLFGLFQNEFLFNAELDQKLGKYLKASKKYETFSGDRIGYLAQLVYWTI